MEKLEEDARMILKYILVPDSLVNEPPLLSFEVGRAWCLILTYYAGTRVLNIVFLFICFVTRCTRIKCFVPLLKMKNSYYTWKIGIN